jgi:hypothetical protein
VDIAAGFPLYRLSSSRRERSTNEKRCRTSPGYGLFRADRSAVIGQRSRIVARVSSENFLVAFLVAAAVGTAVFFHAERNLIRHPS